ncbi:MAG: hypothetical protein P9E88_04420 [Candidatus Competibacter sp.]|nr:hypothetical protein [Candidatus Competibacter sp.]
MLVDSLSLENLQEQIEQLRHGLRGEIPDGKLVRVYGLNCDSKNPFALQARFINALQRAAPGSLGFGPSPRPPAGD